MSLFVMCYVLLLITDSIKFIAGMDDSTTKSIETKNETIDTLVRLQSLDRGDFSKPKIDSIVLRFMSLNTLDILVQEANVELKCSYLYFAMLHMHIIETYMSNLKNLTNLSDEDVASIMCSQESAVILALVHSQNGEGWKDIRSVMWIFHIFAETTANFLQPIRIELQAFNETSVVYAYNAVKALLGEFSSTIGCKTYGTLRTYEDLLENAVFGGIGSIRQEALINKERFRRQTEHNAQLGWIARDTYRFSLHHLHINNLFYNEQIIKNLITFGLPVNWRSIVAMVENLFERVNNDTIFLTEYIQALRQFQLEYIRMLGNVAVQVVVNQLLYVKLKMATMRIDELFRYAYRNCNNIGKEIAKQLTLFAEYVRLFDRTLSRAIDSTRNSVLHLSSLIEYHVYNLLRDLNDMYPHFGVVFRHSEVVSKNDHLTRLTTDILAISREYQLDIDLDTDNPMLVQVFVEYIKKVTSAVDFGIIGSFIQLTGSSVFRRFAKKEKEVVNQQLLHLGIASSQMFDRGARP